MTQPRIKIWTAVAAGLAVAGLVAPAAHGRPLGGGYVTGAYGAPAPIGLAPQTSGVSREQSRQRLGTARFATGAYGAPSAIALGPQTSGVSREQSQQRLGTGFATGAYGAPHAVALGPETNGDTTAASRVATAGGDNFDWNDAGIGGAAAFGLSILLIGSLIVVRRRSAHVAL